MKRDRPPENTPKPRNYSGGSDDFKVIRQQEGHIAGYPFAEDCDEDDQDEQERYGGQ